MLVVGISTGAHLDSLEPHGRNLVDKFIQSKIRERRIKHANRNLLGFCRGQRVLRLKSARGYFGGRHFARSYHGGGKYSSGGG